MTELSSCENHPDGRPVATCIVCGKTVCVECLSLYGYFCSETCKAWHKRQSGQTAEDIRQVQDIKNLDMWLNRVFPWIFKWIPLALLAGLILFIALRYVDKSGKERWTVQAPESTYFADLVVAEGTVYVTRSDGVCLALDADDGTQKWKTSLKDSFGYQNQLVLTNGQLVVADGEQLSVLNAADGKEMWRRKRDYFHKPAMALGRGGILIAERVKKESIDTGKTGASSMGESFRLTARKNLVVSFLDYATGNMLWKREYGEKRIKELRVGENSCACVSYTPSDYKLQPCSAHKEASRVTVAGCDSCRYVRTDDRDFALDVLRSSDGTRLWSTRLKAGSIEKIIFEEQQVIMVTKRKIYCLDKAGNSLWDYHLPSSPLHVGMTKDKLLIIAVTGKLIAVSGDKGITIWERDLPEKIVETVLSSDHVYVRAAMPKVEKGKSKSREAGQELPDFSQVQMMKEIMGVLEDEDTAGMFARPTAPVLLCYDSRTGRERWRREKMKGDLMIHKKGFMLLYVQLPFGLASMYASETPTFISSHSAAGGKRWWRYKSESCARNVKVGKHSVFLTTRKWTGGSRSLTVSDSRVHAVYRRGLLNKITKF